MTMTFFFADNSLFAESIRLTSGQVLDGTILEESEKVVVIQTSKGIFTVRKTDILEMERPGSKDTIIKPPAEKKLSKINMTLLSFIPGYSPIYQSKEHPEFGVPFAMLSLNYFYHFLQFQFNSKRASFLHSIEMKDPFGLVFNLSYGPNAVATEMGLISNTPSSTGQNFNYGPSAAVYFNARTILYQKHSDRIVEGRVMTEDEYLKEKKRYLGSFVAASILNGAVAYFLLSSENNIGALYKMESNGIKTIFYAFPSPDGGIFGAAARF